MAGAKAFAGAPIRLRAAAIAGLDAFPAVNAPSQALALSPPIKAASLFNHLKSRFKPIDTVAKPPTKPQAAGLVRKALPDSYLAQLPPGRSTSRYVASADEYGCTIAAESCRICSTSA